MLAKSFAFQTFSNMTFMNDVHFQSHQHSANEEDTIFIDVTENDLIQIFLRHFFIVNCF